MEVHKKLRISEKNKKITKKQGWKAKIRKKKPKKTETSTQKLQKQNPNWKVFKV